MAEKMENAEKKMTIKEKREIEARLKELPKSFKAEEIFRMQTDLQRDLLEMKGKKIPTDRIERDLHNKHKILSHSYPSIFFKTVRGELDPNMFRAIMNLKKKVDEGKMTNEEAKNAVVDGVKKHLEKNGPTEKKTHSKDATVQEFTAMCKSDD